ncbi:MAG: acetate--CoA ligase [Dissulfurispiraceae bacterium]
MLNESNEVLSAEKMTFPPSPEFSRNAYIRSMEEYEKIYKRSVEDPEGFWSEMAEKQLAWFNKWDKVLEWSFEKPEIKWFIGGKLNASYNCLDRFINTPVRNKAALIWESDDGSYKTYTYQQLYYEVNRFANVLKKQGVKKGDRVVIYLPMVPELAISMLACARIGAIHCIVFSGFSANALKYRVQDCKATLVITSDMGIKGGRQVPLKTNCDVALQECPAVEKVIVVRRTVGIDMEPERDLWWHDEMNAAGIGNYCKPEEMDAEDPLFILYASGSTGKPKGVIHTTGGYMLYTNLTFKWIFDYHEEDVHFCTSDIGWVTGHSYIVYGPLSSGATSLMFEGIPTYPDPGRLWDICDKHRVNIFYASPAAIRALMRGGEKWVAKHDLSSLRLIGTAGEPISPEAWLWYHSYIGKGRLPIVDTWLQTETGGILVTPLPGAMTMKPGSANRPFPGIVPAILKEDGSPAGPNEAGHLVIRKPWPGMIRGTYGDPENKRMKEIYFSRFPGTYFTGDGARCDEDGDYRFTGRSDDVINISGDRLGTAEVESALASHEAVAEAAVVGFPHDIKGEGIYVYVTLKGGQQPSEELKKILLGHVRAVIGSLASPDKLQFVSSLPKTRSGKIMRRVLGKIAAGDIEYVGDTSTLADPSVVADLIKGRL